VWDDDDYDEDAEAGRFARAHRLLRRLDARINRLVGWRNGVAATWREHDLDVDWWGFAHTKGAFTNNAYYGFLTPVHEEYDMQPAGLSAEGGRCAPFTGPGEPEWDPWAEYFPPFKIEPLSRLLPALSAQRGGIRFITPPGDDPLKETE
jgi:hypothetical protein